MVYDFAGEFVSANAYDISRRKVDGDAEPKCHRFLCSQNSGVELVIDVQDMGDPLRGRKCLPSGIWYDNYV